MKGVVKKQKIKSSTIIVEKGELIEMVANKFVGVIDSSASTIMDDKNSELWNRNEIGVCSLSNGEEGKRLFQVIRKQTFRNNG